MARAIWVPSLPVFTCPVKQALGPAGLPADGLTVRLADAGLPPANWHIRV